MTPARHKQRGATLLVSLIMLIMLTLFAVSMINSSSLGLRIASNFQSQKVMEQAAIQELENFISVPANFDEAAPQQPAVCAGGVGANCTGGYLVRIDGPLRCLRGAPAPGYSKKVETLSPDDVDWEVTARVSDPSNTAIEHMRITEGVRVRMLAGACPG